MSNLYRKCPQCGGTGHVTNKGYTVNCTSVFCDRGFVEVAPLSSKEITDISDDIRIAVFVRTSYDEHGKPSSKVVQEERPIQVVNVHLITKIISSLPPRFKGILNG